MRAKGDLMAVHRWFSPVTASVVAAVAIAVPFALVQPIHAPWWLYADSDAIYAGSGLQLSAGQQPGYFDHPGFPVQELFAYVSAIRRLADGATPTTFADAQLRDLGQSAPYWRSLAIAFWVGGAIVLALVVASLVGGWWGVAGGLLWVGAPGLVPMSIQYRPDVLLTALTAVIGLLMVRAAERRSASHWLMAAALIGFTATVKANAAGLFAPLALAMVVWAPGSDSLRSASRASLRSVRRRWPVPLLGVATIAFLVVSFNHGHVWPPTTSEEQTLFAVTFIVVVSYAALAMGLRRMPILSRLFQPAIAAAAVAFCIGALVPVVLFPESGLNMLVRVEQTWLGGGVNAGLHYFNFPHDEFWSWPLQQFAVIFVIAAAATAVGVRRLEPAPLILFSTSALMLFLGLVRSGEYYYFGPAYVLAVPAALWLLARATRTLPRLLPVAAVATLLVYVLLPQIHHARDASRVARADERQTAVMQEDAAALLKPGQTALVDQEAPTPDSLYNSLVQNDVQGVPPPAQTRFFEDFWRSPDWLISEHLRVSYYIGRRAVGVTKPESINLLTGTYHVVPLPRYTRRDLNLGVLELTSGPGITSPYKSLNAP